MIRRTISTTFFVDETKCNTVPGLSKTVGIGPIVRVDEFLVRVVLGATKWLLKATGTPRGLVTGRLFIAHCKLLRIWNRRPKPVIGG